MDRSVRWKSLSDEIEGGIKTLAEGEAVIEVSFNDIGRHIVRVKGRKIEAGIGNGFEGSEVKTILGKPFMKKCPGSGGDGLEYIPTNAINCRLHSITSKRTDNLERKAAIKCVREYKLIVGQSACLEAVWEKRPGRIAWCSSNPYRAFVDENGKVTAGSAGIVEIYGTAIQGGKSHKIRFHILCIHFVKGFYVAT